MSGKGGTKLSVGIHLQRGESGPESVERPSKEDKSCIQGRPERKEKEEVKGRIRKGCEARVR